MNDLQYEFNSLNVLVEDLVNHIESTQPIGSVNEQRKRFLTLHREIERLEDEIDLLEDKARANYIMSTLTWEEYRDLKRRLDVLEKRLERAEDWLERIFGRNN